MKLLVVGGGGREHAIIKKLKENPSVETIWALPGNAGMSREAECVPVKATDLDGMLALAKELAVDWVFVAPDDPLVLGMADLMRENRRPFRIRNGLSEESGWGVSRRYGSWCAPAKRSIQNDGRPVCSRSRRG